MTSRPPVDEAAPSAIASDAAPPPQMPRRERWTPVLAIIVVAASRGAAPHLNLRAKTGARPEPAGL